MVVGESGRDALPDWNFEGAAQRFKGIDTLRDGAARFLDFGITLALSLTIVKLYEHPRESCISLLMNDSSAQVMVTVRFLVRWYTGAWRWKLYNRCKWMVLPLR